MIQAYASTARTRHAGSVSLRTGKDALTLPNDDPEWLEFRVEQTTEFMRAAEK